MSWDRRIGVVGRLNITFHLSRINEFTHTYSISLFPIDVIETMIPPDFEMADLQGGC